MFLEFEETAHRYFIPGVKKQFTSVTTLIGKFKQEFNSREIAIRFAARNGNSPEYWIEKWEKGKNEACDRGSKYHKMKEDLVYNCRLDDRKGRLYSVVNWERVLRAEPNHWLLPDGVYLELRVWLYRFGISGSIDKVYITTEGDVRYVDIEDYKTNKEIEKESYKYKDSSHKMMKAPVSHLQDCNFNHYQLQLSLYAYILEQFGFTVRSLTIQHQGHEPMEGLGEPDLKPYICEYLKKEVRDIINTL